ncbi:uncharacterized protein MKK02DRAFT_37689 [Dioszegia hungarica]|uniref:Fcf2 pre-rRNA processing C-terminal domain-containing protein n=1 Tax=Dioszegia hungarica TaxID=4972 RepID=A0AA38LUE4_9TREE|nr:uncharacterized protein MKK02DRAFT_37689 [Dioszegia hungarica]KAI9634814.1 hypothetical protein MKK02DRAFT_37689 [Dioszegia hungarica]
MPTTRRQSAGPSTPSLAASSSTPKPSSSRSRRSLSHTPSQASHTSHSHAHHRSADEIMLDEAEQILHHTPAHHHQTADELAIAEAEEILGSGNLDSPALRSGRLRSETPKPSPRGRARSEVVVEIPVGRAGKRGPRSSGLSMQSKASVETDEEEEEEEEVEEVEDREQASALLPLEAAAQGEAETDSAPDEPEMLEEQQVGIGEDAIIPQVVASGGTTPTTTSADLDLPLLNTSATTVSSSRSASPAADVIDATGDTSSGSETSSASDSDDSDSSSATSDEESESESESEDEDAEEERMEKLLAAARKTAISRAKPAPAEGVVGMGDEDILHLDADEDVVDAPIPQMTIPGLPAPSRVSSSSGTARAGPSRLKPRSVASGNPAPSLSGKGKERAVELDNREYARPLTKREKANQPKKATPSELWSTLPSARADLLPQMKRDYQALALANSMDPKRFMKDRYRNGTGPAHLPRKRRDDSGTKVQAAAQLVQGVVEDTGVGEYAKRKFGDLQWKRMENGRGKGWKKRTKW